MKIAISDIYIDPSRPRRFQNVDKLAISISKYGLFNEIIVEPFSGPSGEGHRLVAGFRRIEAHKVLKLEEIDSKLRSELNELERLEIEVEENLQREQLSWQEEVVYKRKLDELKRRLYGPKHLVGDEGWSQEDTADALGESKSLVQQDIALARAMEVMPELGKSKSKSEALKRFKNEKEKFVRAELLRKVEAKMKADPEDEMIKLICGDAVKVLREMESNSVDMCIADPPFGVDLGGQVGASPAAGLYDTYVDEKEEVYETIRLVIKEVGRVLKPNSHFYLFFPLGRTYPWFIKQLDESFQFVDPLPLIWYKTNKGGSGYTGDTKKRYMLHYQPILFASKGNRPLTAAKSNVIPLDIILKDRQNPAEMPSELMEYFIEQSSLPGEMVLEVYAGTGPVCRAAKRMKRRAIGIEKRQEQIDVIRVRLMEG